MPTEFEIRRFCIDAAINYGRQGALQIASFDQPAVSEVELKDTLIERAQEIYDFVTICYQNK